MEPPKSICGLGSLKGYLDVKIPARKRKSISLFRVQVWKRHCWLVIRGDRSPAEINPSTGKSTNLVNLSIEIYTGHEGGFNHPTEGTILHLDLVHRIRRAKSKSHPFAFEICGRRGEALLYLSGRSESESQKWMGAIRDILWPPAQLENIRKSYPNSWPVSAIFEGASGSEWRSFADVYGQLAVADVNILIKNVHNGKTMLEWPLTSLQKVFVATGGEIEDEGRVFIVQTRESHEWGETLLYFYSSELKELFEGLHGAVSNLLTKNTDDNTSIISDLSELSGALNTVVSVPQPVQSLQSLNKLRKSTSALNVSISTNNVPNVSMSRGNGATCSQNDLHVGGYPSTATCISGVMVRCHTRRKSMSVNNLNKFSVDETDEELENKIDRNEYIEDLDIQPIEGPKDRTSSSGSYNSYRSNDSGIKLSASPSNYNDPLKINSKSETGTKFFDSSIKLSASPYKYDSLRNESHSNFLGKSDSLDSGLKSYKNCHSALSSHGEDNQHFTRECHGEDKQYFTREYLKCNQKCSNEISEASFEFNFGLDEQIGSWCLQNENVRRSLYVKTQNTSKCNSNESKCPETIYRTMSESYKEKINKSVKEELKCVIERSIKHKNTTVYEEIVDVLKPLSSKNKQKENDYEELDTAKFDFRRSYSFQEKSHPPPLPPRRPQSLSPDPWSSSLGRSKVIRKFFGFPLSAKSHSTDSMTSTNISGDTNFLPAALANYDIATVQALGTLPRMKKRFFRPFTPNEYSNLVSTPKISSQERVPRLFSRPKNFFSFPKFNKREKLSPHVNNSAFSLQRQFSGQCDITPTNDLANMTFSFHEASDIGNKRVNAETLSSIDSCKLVAENGEFNTLTRKNISKICATPISNPCKEYATTNNPYEDTVKPSKSNAFTFSNLYQDMSSTQSCKNNKNFDFTYDFVYNNKTANRRSPSKFAPNRSSSYDAECLHRTNSKNLLSFNEHKTLDLRLAKELEPHYVNTSGNLSPEADYMSAAEVSTAFKKTDDGGYLSMSDLRQGISSCNSVPRSYGKTPHLEEKPCCSTYPSKKDKVEAENVSKTSKLLEENQYVLNTRSSCFSPAHCSHFQNFGDFCISAPCSRKVSGCDIGEYLTPQEVSKLLRQELISARAREAELRELELKHQNSKKYSTQF